MLTPAQQKIKRELEELQLKGPLHEQDQVSAVKRKSKSGWIYFMIAFILIMFPFLARSYYKEIGQERATDYLLKVFEYEQSSNLMLKEQATSRDFEELRTIIYHAKKLNVPGSFKDHKDDLIAVLEQKLIILKSPSKRNRLTLNVKIELARDSMLKGLKKENIKYKVLKDGTIQFWMDEKAYQY